jgi:small multidrug resistance pump
MHPYIVLFLAIFFEVLGTLLLPVSNNFTKLLPSAIIIISYIISFYFLSVVSQQLPLAMVYSTWAGVGIFTIAILSFLFYKQTLNWQTILGLILIIIGVVLVNIFKVDS